MSIYTNTANDVIRQTRALQLFHCYRTTYAVHRWMNLRGLIARPSSPKSLRSSLSKQRVRPSTGFRLRFQRLNEHFRHPEYVTCGTSVLPGWVDVHYRDDRKSRQMAKITEETCEHREIHGRITASTVKSELSPKHHDQHVALLFNTRSDSRVINSN